MKKIAVVDYGLSNILSVAKALQFLGLECLVTNDIDELRRASGIILPGVGAFYDAMEKIESLELFDVLCEQAKIKPFLGICLGMQLLFSAGTEVSSRRGLDLLPGEVRLMETSYKLPHIGWNSLKLDKDTPLTKGLRDGDYVYFVHSYAACLENKDDLIASCDYGITVPAIVGRDYCYGCQFHPEKSGQVGLKILKNFGEMTLC